MKGKKSLKANRRTDGTNKYPSKNALIANGCETKDSARVKKVTHTKLVIKEFSQ